MAHINFSWDHDEVQDCFYRLYEDNELIVDNIEALHFDLIMDGKRHQKYEYHVTAVNKTTNLESSPSNAVEVEFTVPKPPTNLQASWRE